MAAGGHLSLVTVVVLAPVLAVYLEPGCSRHPQLRSGHRLRDAASEALGLHPG